jgi:hypothetical protein
MKVTLVVYKNSDDALLLWTVDELDDNCLGFAIQRRFGTAGSERAPEWLDNWAPPGTQAHQVGKHQSSEAWPFRAFSWTDHSVDPGDVVGYRIVPVISSAPAVREDLASAWSPAIEIGDPPEALRVARFNRGFVISQFVSRYLDEHYPGMDRDAALSTFKNDLGSDVESAIRVFLSGQVRETMLTLLGQVKTRKGHLFAAIFELGDQELVTALASLGSHAHVVLANGSISAKSHETVETARKRDENEAARATLVAAHVDVEESNRFVSPGALAHNKFAVFTDARRQPLSVWTGSTNWTTTGLCTQLNNGVLINQPTVAQLYFDQWHALRSAGSAHPAQVAASNCTPGSVSGDAAASGLTVQFTRAKNDVDLASLRGLVLGATEGVLFLMFMPGSKGVLEDVRELQQTKPDLLVRGVVSELPEGPQDEHTGDTTSLRVTLAGGNAGETSRTFDVVQPQGFAHPAAGWAIETTRAQFLSDIGFAIIHSKVLVIDPFSAAPVVVTGSHNFSLSASRENDENYVVIRGDRALAEAYAVNVESAWRHYAARVGHPHQELQGIAYLRAVLADQQREAGFWHI